MKNRHKKHSVHHNSKDKIHLVNPDVEKKFKEHIDRNGLKFKRVEYKKDLESFQKITIILMNIIKKASPINLDLTNLVILQSKSLQRYSLVLSITIKNLLKNLDFQNLKNLLKKMY